jgi:hypothetical protein
MPFHDLEAQARITQEASFFSIYCIKLPTSLYIWELRYGYLHEIINETLQIN